MIRCKNCNSSNVKIRKSWTMESGRSNTKLKTSIYDCRACKKSFRVNEKIG